MQYGALINRNLKSEITLLHLQTSFVLINEDAKKCEAWSPEYAA